MMKQKYNISFYLDWLILVFGVLGLVGNFIFSLQFPNVSYMGLFFIFAYVYFYYELRKQEKKTYGLVLGTFIALIVILWLLGIRAVVPNLVTIIVRDLYLNFELLVTDLVLPQSLIAIALVTFYGVLIFHLTFHASQKKKTQMLSIFVMIVLFIFPILIKHEMSLLWTYVFIVYLFYTFIFQCLLYQRLKLMYLRIITLCFLSILMVLSHIYIEPLQIFNYQSSTILNYIWNQFQGTSAGGIGSSTTGVSSVVDGSLPTSDVSLSNGLALTVEAQYPFSGYLRGYSLAHYEDNQWTEVHEQPPIANSLWQNAGFLQENAVFQSVKVTSSKPVQYQFTPYYPTEFSSLIFDSYYPNNEEIFAYIYPVGIDLINKKEEISEYDRYVKEEYLEVPPDLKNYLKIYFYDYAGENVNIHDQKEVIEAVDRILSQQTEYSLNSGFLPGNKDFVEYFLFENRKGSCTHYATAGTLLLRTMNIPARYVRGFVIDKSDFKYGIAKIPNYRSHAWTEVYCQGMGWIPIDFTPASTNGESTEIDEMLDQQWSDYQQDSYTIMPYTPEDEEAIQQDPSTEVEHTASNNQYKDVLLGAAMILSFVFVLILYRFITTHYLKIISRKQSPNQKAIIYYRRMNKMLKFGGQIDDSIQQLVYKARFSPYTLTHEELKSVLDYYDELRNHLYKQLSFIQKIYFRLLGYK